jgi:hypothetical protein
MPGALTTCTELSAPRGRRLQLVDKPPLRPAPRSLFFALQGGAAVVALGDRRAVAG